MALLIRTRSSFPHSQSLPPGSFHRPLTLIHQTWEPQSQKTSQADYMDHSPVNDTQWNYEPCHVGPPKMDGSWWRVLIKRGPLEKGMANHFSILALRTRWAVWKGKKRHDTGKKIKSKRVPQKHLLLIYWLHQSLWLCGSQQTVENSSRDGNTRLPYLPPEKSVCRSGSNS